MAASLRVKKAAQSAALTLSFKSRCIFSNGMGTKSQHVLRIKHGVISTNSAQSVNSMVNTKPTCIPLIAIDIADITPALANEALAARITASVGHNLVSHSFIYGNWRRTDTQGLIKGVGRKDENLCIAVARPNTLLQVFGVYKAFCINQGVEVIGGSVNGIDDVEEVGNEGGGANIVGVKDSNGDGGEGCTGCDGCQTKGRKASDDCKEMCCQKKKIDVYNIEDENSGTGNVDDDQVEDADTPWGRCSYPYTSLF